MSNYKKIFLRRIILLTIILVACYLIISQYSIFKDKFDYTANGMLLDLAIGAVIFVLCFALIPLSLFYYLRIKNKIEVKNLNKIFEATIWFLMIIIIAPFVLILWEIFYFGEPGIGLWVNLKISFLYHFSWSYLSDMEYGFIDNAKQMIIFLPYLAVNALLYLTLRNNKLFASPQSHQGSRDGIICR